LLEAGFPLRKFATNSAELQKLLPEHSSSPMISIDIDQTTKVLGLVWDRISDCFTYKTSSILSQEEEKKSSSRPGSSIKSYGKEELNGTIHFQMISLFDGLNG